jgi:hypothetical protein
MNLEYVYFTNAPNWAPDNGAFEFQMGLYDLDVTPYESGDAYFTHINSLVPSKKRIKYNAEYRKVKEQLTAIHTNKIESLERLFEFNVASVTMDLISFEVNGEIHDVELALKYGNTLYHLTGSTSKQIQNVGKFANLHVIDLAIKLGCTTYNAGTGDYNWKEKLGLKKVDLYKYIKKS